jgi:2-polyprenyl-3-methyl-5-hydroxy-6-metoxy-1,4-benzoquinol methylase
MIENFNEQEFRQAYRETVKQVMQLLPKDLSAIAKHNAGWRTGSFDPEAYLLDSEARYLRALRIIRQTGSKRILDVGGFMAAFPLTLARFGFSVAIAEKFGYYDHALDRIADHLRSKGVEVIDADFTEPPIEATAAANGFDAVTCMAVAEHLAHTPRFLLENIHAALRPGGSLVFEVPNHAFWPRRAAFFLKGTSVHSPMSDVYHSAIPYTGHHREYTLSDGRYVAKEAGFEVVSEETFNYSLDASSPWTLLKYAPAFLFKECAEVLLFHFRKRQ